MFVFGSSASSGAEAGEERFCSINVPALTWRWDPARGQIKNQAQITSDPWVYLSSGLWVWPEPKGNIGPEPLCVSAPGLWGGRDVPSGRMCWMSWRGLSLGGCPSSQPCSAGQPQWHHPWASPRGCPGKGPEVETRLGRSCRTIELLCNV